MDNAAGRDLKPCLRAPIPEIERAARMLEAAVAAHLLGDRETARRLLHEANDPAVRAWTESLWGKNSPYATRARGSRPPKTSAAVERMPSPAMQVKLHERDGYHCRYCGIPVIRKKVRERVRQLYPELQIWGRTNKEQHAAFQAMWAQYDHVVPHWLGGVNTLDNLIVTCAPCNYGRMGYTLDEADLADPRLRAPRVSRWDGLERLLAAKHL